MSSATWEEIKRLAADFQRVQLTETSQRLSERNCVELIQRLVELKLVDVIYTSDGKSYLTPQELTKEIREELVFRGGRVNLVDLQSAINVDLSHIEAKVNDIVKGDRQLRLVLGQLIDRTYIDGICEEINDKLQDQGQVHISDLTKSYHLPTDLLTEVVKDHVGGSIQGHLDAKNVLYTEAFINRHRAAMRGAFSGITKPVAIHAIIQRLQLQEGIALGVLEKLIAAGRLAGTLNSKTHYVPDVYSRTQQNWADRFVRQNGYIEYDSVRKLGIADPKQFITKRFKDEGLIHFVSCAVGKPILEQIEAEIDEIVSGGTWLDIGSSVPPSLQEKDSFALLQHCLRHKQGVQLYCDTIVVTDRLIANIRSSFDKLMSEKAEQDVKTNHAFFAAVDKKGLLRAAGLDDGGAGRDNKKDERRKKAAGGTKGGGAQGRETKTKSAKKKGRNVKEDLDMDDDAYHTESQEVEFMAVDDIESKLKQNASLTDAPDELTSELAQQLYRPLRRTYQDVAREAFQRSAGAASGAGRRRTHGELRDKVMGLWTNARLFERGAKLFTGDAETLLYKHLLKTVCTEITNLTVLAVAQDHMVAVAEDANINADGRLKLISKIPEDNAKQTLTKLHTSLNSKNLDDFFQHIEDVCSGSILDIALKKPDKKKERTLIFNHRQGLLEQLKAEADPALTLHLASVVLFTVFTGQLVHAPGRCVPQILGFLEEHLNRDSYKTLLRCQELVLWQIKLQSSAEKTDENNAHLLEIEQEMTTVLKDVKTVACTAKKGGKCDEDD